MRLKKILSLLLAMTMLFSCIGITAFAEDDGFMNLGDIQDLIDSGEENIVLENNVFDGVTDEAGLKKALQAGGSITLGGNIEITEMIEIPVGVEVKLDLAGYSITSGYQTDNAEKHIYPFDNYGVLTILDSSAEETGSISGRGIYVQDGSTLNAKGGTIYGIDANGGSAIYQYGGAVNISGGTIEQTADYTYNYAIYAGGGEINISGGKIIGKHGALSVSGADAIVTGGELICSGNPGWTDNVVYVSAGSLRVDGGKVVHNGADTGSDSGAAVVAANNDVAITINDGSFTGLNGTVSGNVNTTINGGTFEAVWEDNGWDNMLQYVTEGSTVVHEGKTYVKTEEGLEEVAPAVAEINGVPYGTLADAITAANAMTGDVVVELYGKVEYTDSTPELAAGKYDSISFVGMTDDAEISITRNGSNGYIGRGCDAKVRFTGLILSKPEGSNAYDAECMNLAFTVYDAGSVEYIDCIFPNGACASGCETTYIGCTFQKSHEKYPLWTYGDNTVVVVDDCIFDDDRGIKLWSYATGDARTELTVTNCDFSKLTAKQAIVLSNGKSVEISGNEYSDIGVFELEVDGKSNGIAVSGTDVDKIVCGSDNGACGVLVDGKIYRTVEDAAAVATAGSEVTLLHDSTETVEFPEGVELDKNGFEAAGVTVPKSGLSGAGTEKDPYLINNLAELKWFRDNVNTYTSDGSNQYKGKYVKLNADIDLAGENWEPIGNNANDDHESFMGIFDGGGHTIKNLYVNSDGDHLGFFARIGSYAEGINPTVKNITFENVDVSSNTLNGHGGSYVGGVIANAGGNSIVENVKVKGNIYVTGYGYVGGIVGHGYPDLTDCSVIGNDGSWVHAHYWCAGGIIGYAGEGGTPITNCQVEGLDIWSAYGAAAAVAGLLQDGNKLTNVSAKDVEITSNSDYCMGVVAGNGEASTLINVTATNVTAIANGNEITYTDAVAKVNNTYYTTLEDAIIAAAPNGTVEILSDIEVDEWVMFSQTKTIGGDTLITLDMNGLTINGNDHTLTVKAVESATNGDYLFDTADNIIINDLTVNLPAESNGLVGGSGGTLTNVNINGGSYSLTVSKTKNLTIKNCTFTKESGTAIYTPGDGDNPKDTPYTSKLTIDGCTFNVATAGNGYAVILRGENDVFTNNVTNNKVNVLGENCTLTGNTFNARLKFYPSNPTVKDNKILSTVEYADDTETIDLSQNYWGENMNEETILAKVGEKATVSSYYTTLNADGTLENLVSIKKAVAQIGEVKYTTLEAAIEAAQANDTIILLDNVTEDVTIDKSITLDGGNFKYTGNISVSGSTSAVTVKNVKFENGTGYAITTNRIKSITVEDCTVNNYGYGFLYANKSTPTVVVKNVTVDGRNYGFHWVYGTSATLENVTMTNVTNGLLIQNYAGKTVTLKNCNLSNINIWERDGYSGVQTFKFEGSNTVSALSSSQYAKYVLAAADATLTAPEGYNVTTDLKGYIVKYVDGVYKLVEAVAQIGDTYYETFEDALNAVEDGQTITLLDVTGSELSTEIEFTKDIAFTITGNAPDYALPVVTFQNADVTIKNAEILIPELDARQNATINVVDSIVHDAGGNSIVKSYYNGAINISGASVVHTMQVTTMGYITISDTAKLNATWQTNVYGNGLITVEDDATFATAALQLTGKDYSGRDNTDADRVGKPAEVVVDGANLIIGNVKSDNGADYSYNSAHGINIGTIEGKKAILNTKNGAKVNIYMADGEKVNIGADGTVNVSDSALITACRKADGTVTLANNGTINVSGASDIVAAKVTGDGWVYMNGVTLDTDTKLIGAKVRFASGTNNIDGSVIDDGFFQVGIGAYNGVDANVDTANGVTVNVKNATIGSNGDTYAGWVGTGFYDTDDEKATAMTDAKYVLNIDNSIAEFGYLHISNDGELNVKGNASEKTHYNNSDYSFYAGDFIINGTATFDATDVLAIYTKVSCNNSTDKPGTLNIVNGADYEAERHNGAINGTNFVLYKTGVVNVNDAKLHIGEYTTIAADAVMNIGGEVTALGTITNNGTINLTTVDATLTAPETSAVKSTVDGYEVSYSDGKYIMEKVSYVAQIGDTKYTSLQEALDAAAAGTGNVTVEILDDIDLTNVDWNPVTVSAPGYPVVTVNGNSKTITGLNDMLFAGTWAGGSGLIINDLTIKDSIIENDVDDTKKTVGVGAFIGYPQASATITLKNCHLVNSHVEGGHWTGGLIGMAGGYNGTDGPVFMNLTITGCSVTGSTIIGKGSAGGVIGHGSCAAWTNVVIEDTTVFNNTITSTGSSTNKAGAVMGTIGAAGQSTTVNGETKTGSASVSATVSGNTVTSGGTTITTIYGRQGTSTGMLYVTGGNYDNYPIEENVAYAQPKEGYEIVKNEDNTYGVVEKEAVELFEFDGTTVTLGNSLAINFYVKLADLDGEDYYAEIVLENGEKVTIPYENWSKRNENGVDTYRLVTYDGLAAKQMTDKFSVTIYNGKGIQVSETKIDSMRDYAERGFVSFANNSKLMTALIDMLNYGAAAQVKFNYKTETLANAGCEQYQKYASTDRVLTDERKVLVGEDVFDGTTLSLENNIVLNAYFKNLTADMKATIEYTTHSGILKTINISGDKFIKDTGSAGLHIVKVDTVAIADAEQIVKITVYDANGEIYCQVIDSVSSYLCRAMKNWNDDIYKMTARFTYSAREALKSN